MTRLIAYGPVSFRRLGHSLGINNIPSKICTYSFVYCQLGTTLGMEVEARSFYKAARIREQVKTKVKQARDKGELVDYLTFVPNGEPALDADLGREIDIVSTMGIRVAGITNGSLLWREDVRRNLRKSDWVSLKVDALTERMWHKNNRPHELLELGAILQGMVKFAQTFNGELIT